MNQLQSIKVSQEIDMFSIMDKAYKFACIIAKSDIVPAHYKGKPENVFIAVQTAYRMNLDPMMIMQSTFVVSGKLGMTSAFAISLANSSGLLDGGIRYRIDGSDAQLKVTAYTNLKKNGEEISFTISMREAQAENWTKNPKYKTLPELMLRYRAATLLIRTHIPEVLNGMHMVEELEDVSHAKFFKQDDSSIGSRLSQLAAPEQPKEQVHELAQDDRFIARRNMVFDKLKALGIPEQKIFAFYGKQSIEEFTNDEIVNMIEIGIAIKEGSATLAEAFETDLDVLLPSKNDMNSKLQALQQS